MPWSQFSLVLFLQLAEPLTSQVIFPFTPQLIREIGITHGDDKQVGYYVGLLVSLVARTICFVFSPGSAFSRPACSLLHKH